jgi:hypothetical protein
MTGFGAVGTVLLATLTFITISYNQVLVNERLKERQKNLEIDLSKKIIWPAFDAVSDNRERIRNGDIDWMDADVPPTEDEIKDTILETIAFPEDPVTAERFSNRYPEVAERMCEYDKTLLRLESNAQKIIREVKPHITDHIYEGGVLEDSQPVDQGKVINNILNKRHMVRADQPDWWRDNRSDFLDLVWDHAGGEYKEFKNYRNELLDSSISLESELKEIRKDIEPDYGIYRPPESEE